MFAEFQVAGRSAHLAVARLLNDVYVGEGYIPPERAFHVSEVTAWAAHATLIVAWEAEAEEGVRAGDSTLRRLAGLVGLVPGNSGITRVAVAGEGEVQRLAVAPRARGHGVAEALVLECIRRSRAAGDRRLVLWTRPEMTAAQRLYERLGFRHEVGLDTADAGGYRRLVYVLDRGSPSGA